MAQLEREPPAKTDDLSSILEISVVEVSEPASTSYPDLCAGPR